MTPRPTTTRVLALLAGSLLAGCGGFFESELPSPQAYVLRVPPRATPAAIPSGSSGTLRVQRPEAGPGLNSEHIALLRSDRRLDFYSATRWAAPAPDLLESLIVDSLRGSGLFSAVFDDSSPYAPHYTLRCALSRFEADYTAGGDAPTVHTALDCTLGRHRDRVLLANFMAQGSAVAGADRLSSVVAAFEAATAAALAELQRESAAALAAEPAPPAAPERGPESGR
jgi:cholesterol transport system auxiliary component